MKAIVTRIFEFNDEQIKKFMEYQFGDEDEEYTQEDVEDALDDATADELEEFGDCHFVYGHDIEVNE